MKGEHDYFTPDPRATIKANLIQPDANWMTTDEATQTLGLSADCLHDWRPRLTLRCKSRSRNGNKAQAVGRLWWRADIERLNQLRRECQLQFAAALRVLAAEKAGRI